MCCLGSSAPSLRRAASRCAACRGGHPPPRRWPCSRRSCSSERRSLAGAPAEAVLAAAPVARGGDGARVLPLAERHAAAGAGVGGAAALAGEQIDAAGDLGAGLPLRAAVGVDTAVAGRGGGLDAAG